MHIVEIHCQIIENDFIIEFLSVGPKTYCYHFEVRSPCQNQPMPSHGHFFFIIKIKDTLKLALVV